MFSKINRINNIGNKTIKRFTNSSRRYVSNIREIEYDIDTEYKNNVAINKPSFSDKLKQRYYNQQYKEIVNKKIKTGLIPYVGGLCVGSLLVPFTPVFSLVAVGSGCFTTILMRINSSKCLDVENDVIVKDDNVIESGLYPVYSEELDMIRFIGSATLGYGTIMVVDMLSDSGTFGLVFASSIVGFKFATQYVSKYLDKDTLDKIFITSVLGLPLFSYVYPSADLFHISVGAVLTSCTSIYIKKIYEEFNENVKERGKFYNSGDGDGGANSSRHSTDILLMILLFGAYFGFYFSKNIIESKKKNGKLWEYYSKIMPEK